MSDTLPPPRPHAAPLEGGDVDPAIVRLASPRDVLDAIPHSLGFVPYNSLIIVLLREVDDDTTHKRRRTVLTMRVDLVGSVLPAAELMDWSSIRAAVRSSQATSSLMAVFVDDEPAGAAALWQTAVANGVERDVEVDSLGPMRAWMRLGCALDEQGDLLRTAGAVLTETGAPMADVLVVVDNRYFSLMCEDDSCCPTLGIAYDSHVPGAAGVRLAVEGGSSPFSTRQVLLDRFARNDEACLRMSYAIAGHAVGQDVESAHADAGGNHTREAMVERILRAAVSTVEVDVDELAGVLVALGDVHVRDAVVARAIDPERATSAEDERLLRDFMTSLTRSAPNGYRAAPATLAAILWWIDGDGASANIALDSACADQSDYRLALLMVDVVRAAVPPSAVRDLLMRAA